MIKLHFPNGQSMKYCYDSGNCTVGDLISFIKENNQLIKTPEFRVGYPPQVVHYVNLEDNLSTYIQSGSALTVTEKLPDLTSKCYVIPADNSCLFNAIIKGKKLNETADHLREIIANIITADPTKYNSTFLGKEPSEYCQWIRRSSTWGGEIECLSVDHLPSLILDSKHPQRIFYNTDCSSSD